MLHQNEWYANGIIAVDKGSVNSWRKNTFLHSGKCMGCNHRFEKILLDFFLQRFITTNIMTMNEGYSSDPLQLIFEFNVINEVIMTEVFIDDCAWHTISQR